MQTANKSGASKKKDNFILRCFGCGKVYEIDDYGKFYRCLECGNLLEVKVKDITSAMSEVEGTSRRGVWKYLPLIPLWREENIVSLSEGSTSLVECRNVANLLGIENPLYLKFEGQNPTGSFKDRGMTAGVSKAKELGFRAVICASTGNTSASLAAYSARAGLRCSVLIPKGKIAIGKVAQAIAYGAEIFQVEGNFDDCLRVASEISEKSSDILLLNSLNPFRIEGQKTTAFEVAEQLGSPPDYVVLPVGNGGNISSIWKGFVELTAAQGRGVNPTTKMIGVQAEGAAPVARAFLSGREDSIQEIKDPRTEASAINIGSPVSWQKALAAIRDSSGFAGFVSDEEIFKAQRLLASKEGLFVEPASAAPIAYLFKLMKEENNNDALRSGGKRTFPEKSKLSTSTIVCVATGHGLKDPNALLKDLSHENLRTISPNAKSLSNGGEKILISA